MRLPLISETHALPVLETAGATHPGCTTIRGGEKVYPSGEPAAYALAESRSTAEFKRADLQSLQPVFAPLYLLR